jgi:iron-sulfur cluster repair protein YtfE (RIC family)
LRIARRQVISSLEVANKQIVAPMRQAWINSLRDVLSELTSSALHYLVAGYEDRTDEEYQRLTLLEHKVGLMLNFKEEDHRKLEQLIRTMISSLETGKEAEKDFQEAYPEVLKLSREVLKREWDRVKEPIEV